VEAVYILLKTDSIEDALLIDVLRKWQLHQYAVDSRICIVALDNLQNRYQQVPDVNVRLQLFDVASQHIRHSMSRCDRK